MATVIVILEDGVYLKNDQISTVTYPRLLNTVSFESLDIFPLSSYGK